VESVDAYSYYRLGWAMKTLVALPDEPESLGGSDTVKKKPARSCLRAPVGGRQNSRVQLFSKFVPVHDRAAKSISPSLTMLLPSEM
jgi:hypothetical protein